MDIKILIPEKYFYYLENFKRSSYRKAFMQYCSEAGVFFSAMDGGQFSPQLAASELIANIDARLPKRFRRKLRFFDLKQLLFLYTVPAAISHGSEHSIAFVSALLAQWNERYPDDMLNSISFEKINGSFNDTIMGFQFGGSK